MESEDFLTMESLLEVSLIESGQQINLPDEIEEVVVIDDPVTEVAPAQDTRTKPVPCISDKIGKHQGVPATIAEAVRDQTKSPGLSAVNGNATGDKTKPESSPVVNHGAVEDEKNPASLSAVNGDVAADESMPASLSSVNVKASSISEEEEEFYKEMFKEIFAVANVRLHCTACDRHLGMSAKTIVFSHRILRVLLCQKCYLFYGSGDFPQGDDGSDMFCRWCGQGGRLLCCSLCSNVFCEKCVSRNFGNTELRKIKRAEDWYCFSCNLKCLWPARATCAALKNAVAELKRKSMLVKTKEERAPFCVDQSKCCSSESPTIRPSKVKGIATSEEQKKPLAMIQPLPKKKVLTPAHVWNVSEVSEPRPGYITVSAAQTLNSPCLLPQILREPPSLLSPRPLQFVSRDQVTPRVQTPKISLPSPPVTTKFECSKTYERIKYVNSANKCITPVRMTPGVGVAQYCNTYSPAQTTPSPQTDTFSSATNSPRSVIRHKFMKIVSAGQSTPTSATLLQQKFAQVQSRPTVQQQQQQQQQQKIAGILPAQQHVAILPSHQVVESTLQLPNPRLLAPNQVYTIPRSYINKIVKSGLGHTQIPAHVFKPAGIPMCPPSLPITHVNNTNDFAMSQHSVKSVDVNKVKSKWFVSSIEKFSGVSCVLWSQVYKLKQTFANMEDKNNVRGMKITAAKLHHLLETAAEHMKDIDRMLGKEFSNWSKSLKTQPEQPNAAVPEVIDITNDDDHPITLMDDTPAEVIEVEISPDIISLGRFSSSADDVQYDGESSNMSLPPAKTKKSRDSNSEKNARQASVVNVQSSMLDHAHSISEPTRTIARNSDESDVTLDLDICCESDEDDRDGDGNTTDQTQVLKCDYKDVWDAVEFDRDSSFHEKLSEVMSSKQSPCVKVSDGMSLNEVSGEVEPDYKCLLQTSPKADHEPILSSLLRGKTTMTQTDSTKGKSTVHVPKKCDNTVQTEGNIDELNLKKSEKITYKCIAVQTESDNHVESQEPVKPWSNEFDSFLKKLDRSSDAGDDPLCIPEPVTAPVLPTSKQNGSSPQRSAAAKENAEHTDKVQRLNNVTLVRNCKVILDKVKFPCDSSVSSNTLSNVRLRVKKEKLDYVDTNRAVSKVLRSERRNSLLESRNLPTPESAKRKRLVKNPVAVDFEHKVKKIKREFALPAKYPKRTQKK